MAAQVGLSQPSVSMRIKKLKENGVLATIVGTDLRKSATFMAKVDVKAKLSSEILDMLKSCPFLLNGFHVSGEYNLCLFFVSEDISTLESIVDGHLRSNPQVADLNFNIIVSPIKELIMPISRDLEKTDTPACGSFCITSCPNCHYYHDQRCLGCPTTTHYKGELW